MVNWITIITAKINLHMREVDIKKLHEHIDINAVILPVFRPLPDEPCASAPCALESADVSGFDVQAFDQHGA